MKVKTGSFVGDGTSSHAITGVSFQPDAVLIQAASQPLQFSTSAMPANSTKPLVGGNAIYANGIKSLDADGFTLGSNGQVNNTGVTYYWIALKDDGAGDLHVGSYTGNGATQTITGVGFQANLIIAGATDGDNAVFKTSDMPTDGAILFDNFTNLTSRITSITSDGFVLGGTNEINHNGVVNYYLCVKTTANIFHTDTYTGNGSSQTISTVGFQPTVVLTRDNTNAQISAIRFSGESTNNSILVDGSGEGTTNIKTFVSNGFTIGAGNNANANGDTYYSFSFADHVNAKTETLTDDFSSGSIDTSKWTNSGGGNITVVAKQLKINTSLLSAYYDLISKNNYDLTSSFFEVNVVSAGNQALNSLEAIIYVQLPNDGNNKLYITISENVATARKVVSGTGAEVAHVTYNPATMKAFRIRESGGNILFDYSADGSSWTNFATVANPFSITNVQVALEAGTYATELSTTSVIFDDVNLVSVDTVPVVTTSAATSVIDMSATGNGNVTSDGGSTVSERGFVISTITNPTISDDKFIISGTTGSFSGSMTALNPNTTYHYRAYATNDIGTGYGSDQTFTTSGLIINPDHDDSMDYEEKLSLRNKMGITGANFSRYDLRKLFYAGDNKMVSQNDAVRAYLQSQTGLTTMQSLPDLWRQFFLGKGVPRMVSLSDMAKYFFDNIGF